MIIEIKMLSVFSFILQFSTVQEYIIKTKYLYLLRYIKPYKLVTDIKAYHILLLK